ncbi:MAG TPA: hypothetical protein VHJ20_10395 [Polyangia bacterium]|nr:hypothetical protein [Polyangia bacterium]
MGLSLGRKCEVFFDERGRVVISQHGRSGGDGADSSIAVELEDLSDLIESLEEAGQKARASAEDGPPTAKRLKPIRE